MPRVAEPAALKLLKGNGRNLDQGGRPVNPGPRFERGAPEPPDDLSPEARREWDRIVPGLEALNLIKPEDRGALIVHCETWSTYVGALRRVRREGMTVTNADSGMRHKNPMLAVAETAGREFRFSCHEFGLTPSSEQNVGRPMESEPTGDDPFADTTQTG